MWLLVDFGKINSNSLNRVKELTKKVLSSNEGRIFSSKSGLRDGGADYLHDSFTHTRIPKQIPMKFGKDYLKDVNPDWNKQEKFALLNPPVDDKNKRKYNSMVENFARGLDTNPRNTYDLSDEGNKIIRGYRRKKFSNEEKIISSLQGSRDYGGRKLLSKIESGNYDPVAVKKEYIDIMKKSKPKKYISKDQDLANESLEKIQKIKSPKSKLEYKYSTRLYDDSSDPRLMPLTPKLKEKIEQKYRGY